MKNKTLSKTLFIILIILLSLILVLGVLGIVLANNIILFILLGLSVVAILLLIILLSRYLSLRKDISKVNDKLDNLYNGSPLIISSSKDEEMKNIFYNVNDISIRASTLDKKHIYIGDKFFEELTKLLNKGYLSKNFAYVRFFNLEEKHLLKIKKKYHDIYISRGSNYFDIAFNHISPKLEFEDFLRNYSVVYASKVILLYSKEYNLKEIEAYLKDEKEPNGLTIKHQEENIDYFEKMLKNYEHIDLNTPDLVETFLKDAMKFLPFSHIGIKIDDEYYLVATYETNEHLNNLNKKDFLYFRDRPFFLYDDKTISIVFASLEEIFFNTLSHDHYELFLIYLKNFLIAELNKNKEKGLMETYDRLESLNSNLSYEVDKNFIVRYASKKLNLRYNNALLGKKCYSALYNRTSPCTNCPFKNGEDSNTYLLGSNKFTREISFDNDNKVYKIYLLNHKEGYVSSKEELYERLLGLLNSDNRGYLLCFKLEALEGLASRNKTDVEVVVKEIIDLLAIYGLDDHLYRKDVDEFVYILEEASVSDAVTISKQVSKAFLEKFNTNNKEVSFTPKMILLSYPLEVNTLFSLDSLCRTLFRNVDKKGRLYRIDEEPLPVDNNRYYMEIVEESYKQNNIPLTFSLVEDKKENKLLKYAYIDYKDDEGKDILESEITLYAKINNVYLTLVERVSKALIDIEGKDRYILVIGKEALVPTLFASIVGYFNSNKAPLSKIVFEIKEKDAYNHKEEIEKILSYGVNLALVINDNTSFDLDISPYLYIKIDGKKLAKDPLYQSKINNLIQNDIEMMVTSDSVSLMPEARYIDLEK